MAGWQGFVPTSQDDEERQLQEALRLSALEEPDVASGSKRKRDAADNEPANIAKRTKSKIEPEYLNGGLRITRTPGRQSRGAKNTIRLSDLVHKEHLRSACMFAFYIAEEEVFPFLPLSHKNNDVPIYVGRDANMDSTFAAACHQSGVVLNGKITRKQLDALQPRLHTINQEQYGKNYHSFYAWSSGSSHTKLLVLVYPDFLRVVITSCNMMNIDVELGDNHWYIHDLPKLPRPTKNHQPSPGFETDLLDHLRALSTPDTFIDSISGTYDFSKVRVHLVTSVPGTHAGPNAERHGLLALRRAVCSINVPNNAHLETCTASIGNLTAKWLHSFRSCALGVTNIVVPPPGCAVPATGHKIFYPTVGDVRRAKPEAQEAASNIGCHTRPWPQAPVAVKNLFHRYRSKDLGWLFHQKLIMAPNPDDQSAVPYYVYIGSANLSQSAWGALETDKNKKASVESCGLKVVKISNFECGVVVPGEIIEELLEAGTGWEEGIVPFERSAPKYSLGKDRPWNDPRWVQGYDESWDRDRGEYSSEPEMTTVAKPQKGLGVRKAAPIVVSDEEDDFETMDLKPPAQTPSACAPVGPGEETQSEAEEVKEKRPPKKIPPQSIFSKASDDESDDEL